MSNLLRLLRTTTTRPININPLQHLRTSRPPKMSNYFSPSHSHSPFPASNPLGALSRTRFFSSYDGPNSQFTSNINTIYFLMGLNVAVYGYGAYAYMQHTAGFPAPLQKFYRNMTMNSTEVLHGSYHQLLTSVFTHTTLFHFGANMITVYYLGQFLCWAPQITPMRLLTIAIGSGLAGAVVFVWQRYRATGGGRSIDNMRSLGFSGALMGITSVAACLAPTTKVTLWGLIPLPLWGVVLGYAVYDGYLFQDANPRIAHSGHLGGLAFGIAYYLLRLRGGMGMPM